MKTRIRVTGKPQQEIVPILSFEFEIFEVRVRRVTRHKSWGIGAAFKRVNIHIGSRCKTTPTPIDAAESAKIFLPSPSPQGLGQTCMRLGARLVGCPAALSSREFHSSSLNSLAKAARESEQIAPESHE